jgi:hypothetical protein
METTTTSTETKQITIDVPAERLAEFYASFARFLAGGPGRGRRRHAGGHGHHGHHGHHCGHHRGEAGDEAQHGEAATATGGTTDV